ncbi:MAG TPA: ATP-binding protein [Anaeromyxobacteraceae bacterium]|nr:ATP-binding protein [Anaeromyxobacteraceae bacterium]
MRTIPRALEPELRRAARAFPVVVLTGPRRSGKTTLLKAAYPGASYHLLEDPDLVARFRADPRTFVDGLRLPAILDEIQHVPEILGYLRTIVDRHPRRVGQFLLTGSQEAPLMAGVSESMAGRAAVLQLGPLSVSESPKVGLLRGGFPEVIARPSAARLWFSSYVQTYLERDVRAVAAIRDLSTFRRFLGLVASRTGQVLNRTDLAAPLGVSVPTVSAWLSILETTGLVLLVPPYFESFGKRLIKSPKLFVADPGLACHLLGLDTAAEVERSPFLGALWEGFVAAEIAKARQNAGLRRELYWFRDQQGLEVDFVVPLRGGRLLLAEAKASRTPRPDDAAPALRLQRALGRRLVTCAVVHRGSGAQPALREGATALSIAEVAALAGDQVPEGP